jgi:hypothetical protein
MAIDAREETVFGLGQAAKYGEQIIGRRLATSTYYRWAQVGVRGIKLETRCLGGNMFTSLEALERFFDAMTAAKRGQTEPVVKVSTRRKRELAETDAYLRKEGLL